MVAWLNCVYNAYWLVTFTFVHDKELGGTRFLQLEFWLSVADMYQIHPDNHYVWYSVYAGYDRSLNNQGLFLQSAGNFLFSKQWMIHWHRAATGCYHSDIFFNEYDNLGPKFYFRCRTLVSFVCSTTWEMTLLLKRWCWQLCRTRKFDSSDTIVVSWQFTVAWWCAQVLWRCRSWRFCTRGLSTCARMVLV